ncbi:hypothetical protein [Pseudomonas lactis]|uniref:hypothetical protein n=1 Tax=Pseudomonas lactis TaxID=1615674 RepID=UPI00025E88F5|nr:hypothetical protein [Pseudomonas lactis]AFJ58364.1 hypothetical protein PflA506_1660 [Pseudomonas fluorescens A506]
MTRRTHSERVDAVNPEWPAEDFAKALPASEVFVRLFGMAQAKEMLKPKSAATKEHENVSSDVDVLKRFRASGRVGKRE